MAKKPGPVAGSLGDTEYYYKSDGTVVDENGVPTSAKIAAMFAAPPVVEAVAIKKTRKKLKKNNAQLAGVLKNTKYYFAPDGSSIVDDRGLPAPTVIANAFIKDREEKRQALATAMSSIASSVTPEQTAKETESRIRTEKFNSILSTSADKLNASNDELNKLYPELFKNLNSVIVKISENHDMLARQLIEQNQNFQDAVIEQLTGTKGPTKAGGSSGKRARGAKGVRRGRQFKTPEDRAKYVRDRSDRINAIREEKNKKALGAVAPILGGIISASAIAITGAGNKKDETTQPSTPRDRGTPTRNEGAAATYSGLGSVSAKYESGGRGVSVVSSGRGDPGGVSYGAHQLATKTGTMTSYLRSSEGQKYAGSFAGLAPGSPEFSAVYKQIAAQDPTGFAESQKAFITRTHYDPVAAHAKKMGYDTSDPRVQEALYSMSVQHGGAKKIVSAAGSGEGKSAEDQVKALYAQRSQYVTNLGQGNLVSRYQKEQRDVLAINAERQTQTVAAAAMPPGAPPPPDTNRGVGSIAGPTVPVARTGPSVQPTVPGAPEQTASLGGAGYGTPTREGENGRLPAGSLAPIGVGGLKAEPSAASAMIAMRAAAKADGVELGVTDAYRSYEGQVAAKAKWASKGQPYMAATPGRSNHGWGLAFDMGFGSDRNSPGYKWMVANAAKFGFKGPLQRPAEAWHWEYGGGGSPGAKTDPVPGVTAGAAASGSTGTPPMPQTASLGPMTQRNAITQNINSMPAPPMIFNNTMNNNMIRTIRQGSSFQQTSRPNPGFNPLAAAVGVAIGSALRGLF
jgi:hypothetical protein